MSDETKVKLSGVVVCEQSWSLSLGSVVGLHPKAILLCAYEVKNNCCLFERLFKVKNGVFLFGISFFIMEIFAFLYYANEESDDIIGGSTKTVQHSITNISRNFKVVFFKLGTRNQHHKRRKMTLVVLLP